MFAPLLRKAHSKAVAAASDSPRHQALKPVANWSRHNAIDQGATQSNGRGRPEARYDPPSPSWDFSRIPIFAPGEPNQDRTQSRRTSSDLPGPIQAKLLVGQIDDPLEHEAERIAHWVMHMSPASVSSVPSRPQLTQETSAARGAAASDTPTVIDEVLRSPGRPLDERTRAYFEPRFGHDFSHVRVHADQRAADAAYSVAARAFTLNEHIVFGDRQYAPDGSAGQHLLAHELAHTIQQRAISATPTIRRDQIPGWNFKPSDLARLKEAGVGIAMASDSGFFPAQLQENLLKTIAFVLGPAIMPPATEGVNAVDFFHGHLVVKKDPKTADQAKEKEAKGLKFQEELAAERTKALGGEVRYSKGYPLTEKNVGKYTQAVEKVLPSFGTLLDETSKLPGAAVMYHTFEFNQPSDLKAQGKQLGREDPRRHYVTPLDTNQPKQYSPPSGGYETEYTHITSFSFLVDDKGKVHVRPFSPGTGFTSLELSTITGTTFAKTSEFER